MSDADYTLYCDRPTWRDIQPIPLLPDSEFFQIDYSPEFLDIMGYYRAIAEVDELSQRALDLTSDLLSLNIANYTAWNYRRRLLKHLKSDLTEERKFVDDLMFPDNTKNYQGWYHRQWMLEEDEKAAQLELDFCEKVILDDQRNLHAWQHRVWVLGMTGGMGRLNRGELEFTARLIGEDPLNNSAWNHRFQLIFNSGDAGGIESAREEIEFALGFVRIFPDNESPWSYLGGVVRRFGGFSRFMDVVEFLRSVDQEHITRSPFFVSTLADCAEDLALEGIEYEANTKTAVDLYMKLAKSDLLRCNYWIAESERVKSQQYHKI